MDHQKLTGYVISWTQYDINEIEMFTSSNKNIVLLVGHVHLNQTGMFTSAPH